MLRRSNTPLTAHQPCIRRKSAELLRVAYGFSGPSMSRNSSGLRLTVPLAQLAVRGWMNSTVAKLNSTSAS